MKQLDFTLLSKEEAKKARRGDAIAVQQVDCGVF